MHTGGIQIGLLGLLASLGIAAFRDSSAAAQELQWNSQPALPTVPEELDFNPFAVTAPSPQTPSAVGGPPASGGVIQSIPLRKNVETNSSLSVESTQETVSIFARAVDLRIILAHLAEESHINIVVAENVQATVTTTLENVSWQHALDALLRINGLVWTEQSGIVFVTRPGNGGGQQVQQQSMPGQSLEVFDLNYTASAEVLTVVTGLLSPSGKAFAHAVDKTSTRHTRERIVVEDYPERLQAIATYLASVDNPPRQVLIEAHVMQVTLDDNQRHGVNLAGLARLAGGRIDVRAQGFANGDASPGFMLGLDNTDLDGMIETLCSDSNVRTLAAPKVLVVNGQEARIQIGSKFGYFVTTTTQTSTLQSVDFLDIGVVLLVQPTITRDNQVLLTVSPKVSGGRINPDSGLPEEDTTEANTTVLLPDGKGMIIGGLIKETDSKTKSWVPWLGKQPVIGHLFSRSNRENQRVEVILALTPHIVPFSPQVDCREYASFQAATNTQGIITSNAGLPIIEQIPAPQVLPPLSQ